MQLSGKTIRIWLNRGGVVIVTMFLLVACMSADYTGGTRGTGLDFNRGASKASFIHLKLDGRLLEGQSTSISGANVKIITQAGEKSATTDKAGRFLMTLDLQPLEVITVYVSRSKLNASCTTTISPEGADSIKLDFRLSGKKKLECPK